jgi:hypothetical protein
VIVKKSLIAFEPIQYHTISSLSRIPTAREPGLIRTEYELGSLLIVASIAPAQEPVLDRFGAYEQDQHKRHDEEY